MSSRHTVAIGEVEAVVREAAAVLANEPAGLISDIDGTLSRIVQRPEDATVSPAICRDLERLAGQLHLVAVVTGRDDAAAHRMLPAQGITFVTHYGVTKTDDGNWDSVHEAKLLARKLLDGIPGLVFEEKDLSLALHYRLSEDPESVRNQIMTALLPVVGPLGGRLMEGKMVVEIVPTGLPEKPSAVQKLVAGLNGVVYLGDDVADAPVFSYLAERRNSGGLSSLSIAAVDEETPDVVRASADLTVNGVDAVETFLGALSEALGMKGATHR